MATMTELMIKLVLERKIFPSKILDELHKKVYLCAGDAINFTAIWSVSYHKFSFKGGAIASQVAKTIMGEYNCEESREHNKCLKAKGCSIADKV